MSSLEIRVCGRYKLEDKLYEGKYAFIYSGKNVQSDNDCAIKCQPKANKVNFVQNQGKILEEIQGGVGIPNLLWHGENGDYNFLITELLGASLEDYFDICGKKFSLKTVLMIADKILSSIEFVHYKNFLHRDIKPANFCVGLAKKLHQIYTIDLAFGATFYDPINKCHRPDVINDENFIGTLKFASLNVQRGHRNSRRDDLESIGLMLIYFLKGSLPWQNPQSNSDLKQRKKEIRKMMEKISLQELCDGLPKELLTYMQYCRHLKYDEAPDYNYIKRIFKEKLIREGYQYDHIFDWILIPLKIKNTDLSNRIPLNRFTKKENSQVDMINADYNFKEDIEFWEQCLKNKKNPKQEKKQLNTIQDTRVTRANSQGGKAFNNNNQPNQQNNRIAKEKKKEDCQIY